MAATQPINLPSPPLNTGYNPEQNVGATGLYQYTTQIAQTNEMNNAGIGGAVAQPTPRTFAPAPFTPKPVPPRVPATPLPPEAPVYTQPQPAPVTPQPPALPAGPQPKDPQPELPNIAILPGRKRIETRPDRYTVTDSEWSVSSRSEGLGPNPNITPIVFGKSIRPELKPLLRTDGVVVKVGEHWLVSPQTLADIQNSGNPHYDIAENGRILNTPMGKTVPVIEVNVNNLPATGSKRDIVNRFAGVTSVDYVYETPTVMGIPEGILEQINYTLDAATERPEDTFEVLEMNLTADYSIEKLTVENAQSDGKLDKEKLQKFVTGVGERMRLLQRDFNLVKSVFYRGEIREEDTKRMVRLTQRATADDTDNEIQKPDTANYTIKTTDVVGHSATPNTSVPTENDGTDTPNVTAGQTDTLIARWGAYGLTTSEKAELKNTPLTGGIVTVTDGTSIAIGGVRWSPTLCQKVKVILPLNAVLGGGKSDTSSLRPIITEYYGANLTSAQYYNLNRKRIGDVLQLAVKIKELEEANSKTY